ncbi:hypothetical protein EV702DRAFT_717515 [Suillus placidus]|uniref:Secreted protein n=1 Tax=Suillus placidus TaxID=48579 RepID=A0A9P7CXL3_9AGAM|nr:hypothetical protein EV702DRAFT_717515 [Suillus placidus]
MYSLKCFLALGMSLFSFYLGTELAGEGSDSPYGFNEARRPYHFQAGTQARQGPTMKNIKRSCSRFRNIVDVTQRANP